MLRSVDIYLFIKLGFIVELFNIMLQKCVCKYILHEIETKRRMLSIPYKYIYK